MPHAFDNLQEIISVDSRTKAQVDKLISAQEQIATLDKRRSELNAQIVEAARKNGAVEGQPISGPFGTLWIIRDGQIGQVEPSHAFQWADNEATEPIFDIADEHNAGLVDVITGYEATA